MKILQLTMLVVALLFTTPAANGSDIFKHHQNRGGPFRDYVPKRPAAMNITITQLTIGTYATSKPTQTLRQLAPTIETIEEYILNTTGVLVNITVVLTKTPQETVDAVLKEQIDIAKLDVTISSGMVLLATESTNYNYGVFVTAIGSAIQSRNEFTGKSIAFGYEGTATGQYLPQEHLHQAGIHVNDLSTFEYIGRYDRVGEAVAAGTFDVGVMTRRVFERLIQQGVKLREVDRFVRDEPIWVTSGNLPNYIEYAIIDGLAELSHFNEPNFDSEPVIGGTDEEFFDVH